MEDEMTPAQARYLVDAMSAKEPMSDDRIIKTYVWHGDKCFFVSTIERDSSAMLGPGRYNETSVWEYDWSKRETGKMLHQDEASTESIRTHQRIVERIYTIGTPIEADEN